MIQGIAIDASAKPRHAQRDAAYRVVVWRTTCTAFRRVTKWISSSVVPADDRLAKRPIIPPPSTGFTANLASQSSELRTRRMALRKQRALTLERQARLLQLRLGSC